VSSPFKYYDRKISALQQHITYLQRDYIALAKAFDRITYDSDSDCHLTLAQLRQEIQAVEDRFPDLKDSKSAT